MVQEEPRGEVVAKSDAPREKKPSVETPAIAVEEGLDA